MRQRFYSSWSLGLALYKSPTAAKFAQAEANLDLVDQKRCCKWFVWTYSGHVFRVEDCRVDVGENRKRGHHKWHNDLATRSNPAQPVHFNHIHLYDGWKPPPSPQTVPLCSFSQPVHFSTANRIAQLHETEQNKVDLFFVRVNWIPINQALFALGRTSQPLRKLCESWIWMDNGFWWNDETSQTIPNHTRPEH